MNLNEIKKALYKEKPEAVFHRNFDSKNYRGIIYKAEIDAGTLYFKIPREEFTEEFTNRMPAQLLIRWLYDFESNGYDYGAY